MQNVVRKVLDYFSGFSYSSLKLFLLIDTVLLFFLFSTGFIHKTNNHSVSQIFSVLFYLIMAQTIVGYIMLKKEKNRVALITDLREAKKRAEESERFKMKFLANMSHEIRTPMNGILGFMELLRSPELEINTRNEYIDLVSISGRHLVDTINDIIELSKIESGVNVVRNSEVDLNKIIFFVHKFFSKDADLKGIQLRISAGISENSQIIITDEYKLQSIISNLVKNAIKYTDRGYIEIGNYITNGKLCIYVSDSGRGISPEHLKDLFDRFNSASQRDANFYDSSGLGLSIAMNYAKALGGELIVKSVLGTGSTLSFIHKVIAVNSQETQTAVF